MNYGWKLWSVLTTVFSCLLSLIAKFYLKSLNTLLRHHQWAWPVVFVAISSEGRYIKYRLNFQNTVIHTSKNVSISLYWIIDQYRRVSGREPHFWYLMIDQIQSSHLCFLDESFPNGNAPYYKKFAVYTGKPSSMKWLVFGLRQRKLEANIMISCPVLNSILCGK